MKENNIAALYADILCRFTLKSYQTWFFIRTSDTFNEIVKRSSSRDVFEIKSANGAKNKIMCQFVG